MGLLTASMSTRALIFLRGLATLAAWAGWKPVVLTIAGCAIGLIPLIAFLVPESPAAIGLRRYGATEDEPPAPALSLAMMDIFDIFGTTFSGWLTDRYDPRKLLFVYYGLRGLSLIYLPYSNFSFVSLSLFAAFYGLDWIATVPPTAHIANEKFGNKNAPIIFGWVVAGHQLGATSAALFAGLIRTAQGSYPDAFVFAGATGLAAAFLSLMIEKRRAAPQLAGALEPGE
jgi:predicted MFS family arabinose efflux permease